jgi:PhnB protein
MPIQPYLFFNGKCDEAIEFYRQALGAEVTMLMRYQDAPEPPPPGMLPPGSENKVMHANIKIGDATILASDGHCTGATKFEGFSLTIVLSDQADAKRKFEALSASGKVQMPLTKTFYSPCFGMLTDKFGVGWMIYVTE